MNEIQKRSTTLHEVARNAFVFLIIGSCIILNGCASYKAQPLEDFTQQNSKQEDKCP